MQRDFHAALGCLLRYKRRVAIAACLLAVSGSAKVHGAEKLRVLTDAEMDQLTAGAVAGASANATAQAIGPGPQSGTSAVTFADAGGSPIAGAPFVNYATGQTLSFGDNALSAQATSASHVSVDGGNGGAGITAIAHANGTMNAQTQMQLHGVSTNTADLAFGSAGAAACCGTGAGAQVTADLTAGGPYSREYIVRRQPEVAGQIAESVDAVVISSTLPIADPARIATAVSARVNTKY